MHEAAFVIGRQWVEHFHRRAIQEGINGDLRVPDLLGWIDEPQPRGLDPLVAQLVIASFAEQTDRTWIRHGAMHDAATGPDRDHLGTGAPHPRTPGRRGLGRRAGPGHAPVRLHAAEPAPRPTGRHVRPGPLPAGTATPRRGPPAGGRAGTAHRPARPRPSRRQRSAAHRARRRRPARRARIPGTRSSTSSSTWPTRTSVVRRSARARASAVRKTWCRPYAAPPGTCSVVLTGVAEPWSVEAAEIFTTLRQAANDDELTTPLAPALHRARTRAAELVTRSPRARPDPYPTRGRRRTAAGSRTPTPVVPARSDPSGRPRVSNPRLWSTTARPNRARRTGHVVTDSDDLTAALDTLREVAGRNPGSRIEITWRVRQ